VTEPGEAAPDVDPSKNVLDLVNAAILRQDDLRAAEGRRVDELAALRALYDDKLRVAESARIDAILAAKDTTSAQTRATGLDARTLALSLVGTALTVAALVGPHIH
jgi:hypothetical protein